MDYHSLSLSLNNWGSEWAEHLGSLRLSPRGLHPEEGGSFRAAEEEAEAAEEEEGFVYPPEYGGGEGEAALYGGEGEASLYHHHAVYDECEEALYDATRSRYAIAPPPSALFNEAAPDPTRVVSIDLFSDDFDASGGEGGGASSKPLAPPAGPPPPHVLASRRDDNSPRRGPEKAALAANTWEGIAEEEEEDLLEGEEDTPDVTRVSPRIGPSPGARLDAQRLSESSATDAWLDELRRAEERVGMPMGGGLTLPEEDTRVRPRMDMSPGTPGWQPLAPPPPVAQRKAAAATKTPGTLSSMIAEHLQSGGMGKKSKVPSPHDLLPSYLPGGRAKVTAPADGPKPPRSRILARASPPRDAPPPRVKEVVDPAPAAEPPQKEEGAVGGLAALLRQADLDGASPNAPVLPGVLQGLKQRLATTHT